MKKVLLFFLLTVIPFIVFAYPNGDVNGNNKVDSMDYILIRKHLIGTESLNDDRLKRADTNNDGKVNSMDYINIRKTIISSAGNPTASPTSTIEPVVTPTNTPTLAPTTKPTSVPTTKPTSVPTTKPTAAPTTKPTTAPTPTEVTENSICESVKNNDSIDYKSFASLKKDNDDYYVIKAAHNCANKYNKPVVVTKNSYHIYKYNNETIEVQTNTDLSNSYIYIHDENDTVMNYTESSIFTITPSSNYSCTTKTINSFNNNFASLAPSSGKYYVRIEEKNGTKVYNRNKDNIATVQSHAKSDVYRVYDGQVQDPMYWDYNNSTVKYTLCQFPSSQLVFKNATMKTITKKSCKSNCTVYANRGILISRSKTKILNIKHEVLDTSEKPIHVVEHKYEGIFVVRYAANIEFENSVVYSLNFKGSDGKNESTYDINLAHATNITLNNVKMSKIDRNYNQLENSNDWGVMGGGQYKNLTILNSELNRIDAHRNVHTVIVKDSVVGVKGLTMTGTGDRSDNKLSFENVTWKYTNKLVTLRADYGTTWNGTISFKNCQVENVPSSTVTLVSTTKLTDNAKSNIVFNHPIYNPKKISVNGLKINSSTVNKVQYFDRSKSDIKKYYLEYFQRKTNANVETEFTKQNITGVSNIVYYTS